ncbi:uncharacterized protein LOC142567225 isoform X2 [Dermacentor variabilis]|uniref:uncharacterized protein LOC142567225 isoform X2 n=1 Tax=Dermacentor variabilis TaxID=34621 RepID=UPI003F5C1697
MVSLLFQMLCTGLQLLTLKLQDYTQTCKLKVQPTSQYPHLLLKLQGHARIHMCSMLCTGRKLPAHSRNCKLACGSSYTPVSTPLPGATRPHTEPHVLGGLCRPASTHAEVANFTELQRLDSLYRLIFTYLTGATRSHADPQVLGTLTNDIRHPDAPP